MINSSLNQLYRIAGLSKQAVHQSRQRQERFELQLNDLLSDMDELRDQHPGCGLEKAYYTLQPDFLGRDRFVDVFSQLGYQLRKKRLYPRTTIIGKRFYDNLIEGTTITAPHQVWQSDITYYDMGGYFAYITFIIDIYSKVIVAHQVTDHLRATANLAAAKKAIQVYGAPLIHHSDRGSQYSSKAYVELMHLAGTQVSMGVKGPDNAYAERINRTIKEEYLDHWNSHDLNALKRLTRKAVYHYNHHRLHKHLKRKTPIGFLRNFSQMSSNNRPIIKIPILNS